MADTYDVMSLAKRQGAEIRAKQQYEDYMEQVEAEQRRAEKAQYYGGLGGQFGGSIASFLAPAIIAAAGIPTGGLGTMLLSGLLGTGIARGGMELGDVLARKGYREGRGGGIGSKEMKEDIKYKALSGAYGQKLASDLRKSGTKEYKKATDDLKDMVEIENLSRWLSSAFSGIGTAGKVRAGAETIGSGIDSEGWAIDTTYGEEASLGDKMMAALQGDVGEGYRAGFGDTSDYWKNLFDSSGKVNPKSISSQMDMGLNDYLSNLGRFESEFGYGGGKDIRPSQIGSPYKHRTRDWDEMMISRYGLP